MKKLFMVAMAAVFSVAMVSTGFAQGTTGTMEKKDDKKAADKMEKKADTSADKMDKKADKKAAKKKAANPCAAKTDAAKTDAKK
jgi:hypothetical protein